MIPPEELEIEPSPESKCGGMCLGIVTSSVKVTHKPTGIMAQCGVANSQRKNKEFAIVMIEALLNHPLFSLPPGHAIGANLIEADVPVPMLVNKVEGGMQVRVLGAKEATTISDAALSHIMVKAVVGVRRELGK